MRTGAVLAALLAAAALTPLGLDADGYALRVLTTALLFAAAAQAWNIVGGLANRLSLGHAAFFGIGAYCSTLLLVRFGLSPWIGMLASAALGAGAALLIGLPTLRLQGHYFALATLAFGEVMRVLANTWTGLTGGPVGLSVPFGPDSLALLRFKSTPPYYWAALGLLALCTAAFLGVRHSALGYRLMAVREDEAAARAIGVDATRAKLLAATLSGALTAMVGTLYAQFSYFFDPDTVFGITPVSVRIALICIVGGIGSPFGPILGALFVIPMEEAANVLFGDRAAGLAPLSYAVVLIAVVVTEPRGLLRLMGSVLRPVMNRVRAPAAAVRPMAPRPGAGP